MKKLWIGIFFLLLAIGAGFTVMSEEACVHDGAIEYTCINEEMHELRCNECGVVLNSGYHYGGCASPEECELCGATGVALAKISHDGEQEWVNIGEEHRYQCLVCGEGSETEEHAAYCEEPATCITCGAKNATIKEENIYHSHFDDEYVNLGDQHQVQCLGCGTGIYDATNHRVWCDATDKCMYCNATGVISGDVDHYRKGHVSIGDQCQIQCLACGKPSGDPTPHSGWCDALDTCYWCGSTGVKLGKISHRDSEYVDLGEQHQKQCVLCGVGTTEPEDHEGSCATPDECDTCGLTGVKIMRENLWHHRSYWEYVNLGDKHQYQCRVCGEAGRDPEGHRANCDTLTRCLICDATDIVVEDGNLFHNDTWVNLGEQHQLQCLRCGVITSELEGHSASCDEPTRCYKCDANGITAAYIDHQEYSIFYIDIGGQHQALCYGCGGKVFSPDDHVASCIAPDWCYVCRINNVTVKAENISHYFRNGICEDCGKLENEPSPSVPGDVDGSSAVTLNDAFVILERSYSSDDSADVTGDGKVDAYDALRILQYLAGWNVTLE